MSLWSRKKFVFAVGIARLRTVTVYAMNEAEGRMKACSELDRRAERKNRDSPVAWDLELVPSTCRETWP